MNWKTRTTALLAPVLLILGTATAMAAHPGKYADTVNLFRNAGQSAAFFDRSYAYAVFPTVGEGAIGVGGAFGKGRVYVHGKFVGDTTMGQVSVGFQAGGKAYSQIIFFEDKRALDEFESGTFEFAAGASAVAVTAGANAGIATDGAEAGASAGPKDARARGQYEKGMAVFTIAKGGLMYSANIAGQKFSYTPRGEG
ncbi:MAG TPA: lipid-binding SYLF domain-containing protein [Steroidobacteraceae bacterium]|jgi:lipid-binding SYLF domain-containing protein|nr:lipid-binding SYLF domain-containing protein [Steroidobacteraceae bacterium]